MPFARRSPLLLLVALAACAAPQDPPRGAPRRAPRFEPIVRPVDAPAGTWGERWLVEAHAIPAAWLTRDVDGTDTDPDAEDAAGWAVRAAAGNRDQSVGVLFQDFRGDAAALDVAAVSLDTDVRACIDRDGTGMFFARAAAGVGAAWLDVPADDPGGQLQAQLRLGLEFQPSEHLILGASFGGLIVGHPGETEAYGTFVTVGGAVVF